MFEIGTSLREARLRHGVDLVEAERATKIRSKYLRALEADQFELLPAQTYVKGFLRSYAEFLGLDGQLYVDEYNSRYSASEEEAPLRSRGSTARADAQRRMESSVLLVTLAGIAAVTALVIVAWKWGGSETPRIAGVRPGAGPSQPVAPQAQPKRAVAPARRWVALRLTATRGDSTIAVYRGSLTGAPLYDGTLELGRSQRFTGGRLWVQLSDPASLVARLDGRLVRLPGDGSQPIVALVSSRGIALAPRT